MRVLFTAGVLGLLVSCAALDPQARYRCEPNGTCAEAGLQCVEGWCIPTVDAGADAGRDGGVPDAGRDGGTDAGVETTANIRVLTDADDGSFCDPAGYEEVTHHVALGEEYSEVGTDSFQCRSVYRFVLPIPKGAELRAATLTLRPLVGSSTTGTDATWVGQSMTVRVFDAFTFPPLNGAHKHTWAVHAAPSVASAAKEPWLLQMSAAIVSPDLKGLIAPLLLRSDYLQGNSVITLLLEPVPASNKRPWWVGFEDVGSSHPQVPTLSVTWR